MADAVLDPRPTVPNAVLGLLAFALAVTVAAAVGGLAAASAAEQYASLARPSWAPPAEVFGPVWTVLYALVAVSGWLVWRRAGVTGARTALTGYGVQLVLNALWTPLFFGAGWYGVAFAELCVLLVAVVATVVLFARHSRLAAGLLVPYLLWIGFACAVNLAVWQLNP
ncbi:MAG TPA: TspO/MBR family protein [Pseudonocardia sp.]|jgi:translocator protein|nr:TspO/MBR family protein [Pseudonocardia sp.]